MSALPDLSDLDLCGKIVIGKQTTWGGYSDISRGTLLEDGKDIEVAVKALRIRQTNESDSTEERLFKRFYREVLLWRGLRHPNVVPLLGYVVLPDGLPTLVCPWYTNGSIVCYLKSNPNPDRRALVLDIVHGMKYLHSIPIAHGDLKGENVLVDEDGHASLCDFGMSQFVDEASRITGFTTANAYTGGTDRYMCPELLEDRPKTTATDMWALACLVVQVLTDEVPYQHITRRQALPFAIMRGELPAKNNDGAIQKILWDSITKCWSALPSGRPDVIEFESCFNNSSMSASLNRLASSFILEYQPHSRTCVELSPDGRYLAAASLEGGLTIWEIDKRVLVNMTKWSWPMFGHVQAVVWSSSQRFIMIAFPFSAIIGDVRTGSICMKTPSVSWAIFSPNGSAIAVVCGGSTESYFKDLAGGEDKIFKIPQNAVCMDFTPDYKQILVADLNPLTLTLIDRKTGVVEANVKLARTICRTICVGNDGKFVLLSYDYGAPELWGIGLEKGKFKLYPLQQYKPPKEDFNNTVKVQFGGLKDQLVIGLWLFEIKSVICIWDRDTATLLHSFPITTMDSHEGDMSLRWNSDDPKDIILVVSNSKRHTRQGSTIEIWSITQPEYLVSNSSDFASRLSTSWSAENMLPTRNHVHID